MPAAAHATTLGGGPDLQGLWDFAMRVGERSSTGFFALGPVERGGVAALLDVADGSSRVVLSPEGGELHGWLFLALAEHRLGRAAPAKAAAARARAVPRPATAWDLAEVEVLTAELDAALPPPGK